MRALLILTSNGFGVDGYVLVKQILEAYLHIAYLQTFPNKAEDLVAARMGLEIGTHIYKTTPKGSIDPTRIIEKATGRVFDGKVSFKTMAAESPYSEDLDVYLVLYDFLSGYTHPDFRRSRSYLSEGAASFEHTGRSMYLEARALGLIVGNMMVHLLFHSEYFSEKMTKDLQHYLGRTRKKLSMLLKGGFPKALAPPLLTRISRFPKL